MNVFIAPRLAALKAGLVQTVRMLAAGAAVLVLAPLPAEPQERVQQEDAREQLLKKQQELEDARSRERQLSGDLEKLRKERAALNKDLIETASRIQESETKLSSIEEQLASLDKEEQEVRASIEDRHATIAKLLAAMQRIGRQPPPALVTQRKDALKMVRSAMLMASVFPELTFQAEGLSAELDTLVRLTESIKLQRDNLKDENEKLIASRDRINGLIAEKKTMAQSREANLEKIRVAAAQHAEAVGFLGELVRRMDKEIAQAGLAAYEAELKAKHAREKAEAEAAKQEGREAPEPGSGEATRVAFVNPGRLKPAVEFAETKGTLARPVSGRLIRPFGGTNDIGEAAKGISILSRPEAQVTAPADGWVAYADEFRTYGQLLIINAGGGYHVLLAGMERIDIGVGQFVLAGEPVAVMGGAHQRAQSDGNGQDPVLYVEFRKDGRPIDPGPWWAKSPERVEG